MKKSFFLLLIIVSVTCILQAQTLSNLQTTLAKPATWKESQLMQPAELASLIGEGSVKKPLIYNIGVVDDIPGARNFGAAHEASNIDKFRKEVENLPKSSFIVVYCGCCPFDRCPNVRPAMSLLNEAGFTNAHLLNIPKNLKTDWIDKGYPVVQKK